MFLFKAFHFPALSLAAVLGEGKFFLFCEIPSWSWKGLPEVNKARTCLAHDFSSHQGWYAVRVSSRVSSINIISPGCPSFVAHFRGSLSGCLSYTYISVSRAGRKAQRQRQAYTAHVRDWVSNLGWGLPSSSADLHPHSCWLQGTLKGGASVTSERGRGWPHNAFLPPVAAEQGQGLKATQCLPPTKCAKISA